MAGNATLTSDARESRQPSFAAAIAGPVGSVATSFWRAARLRGPM
eukprot:CAMPEP_0175763568 /NCGR_PEP_ID=MMETSP0097-20121207/67812_1 /TAXON_ID=311494 /ORGANISM="Alexandrium monilatum, Strain CCMP3105" /LENGTH=44 /DNA_ID= /DNA_START= /DNA_END= /DNA_ORIENTATION=